MPHAINVVADGRGNGKPQRKSNQGHHRRHRCVDAAVSASHIVRHAIKEVVLGLFAFFYGFLHLMTYVWLDQFFSLPSILHDVVKRPFITAGTAGFLIMAPLAVTSTRKWIGRLGGKRWQLLHRLVYLSAAAGVAHYLWLVKADIQRPVIYGVLLSILLGYRLLSAMSARLASRKMHRGTILSYSRSYD